MKSTEIAESLRAKREAAQVLFAKGDDITTEEFASVKSLMEEIKGLDADMKAAEEVERLAAENAAELKRLSQPVHKVAFPSADVKSSLPSVAYTPKSQLRAFGRYENGGEMAYKSGMHLFAALLKDQRAIRYCKDQGIEIKSHVENINLNGGVLVFPEFERAIIDLREQYGVFRRNVRVMPMSSDTLSLPRRAGGLTTYVVGEGATITESTKSWDMVQLIAKKIGILAKISSELSEDAVIAIMDDLANEMAYQFSLFEDQAGFIGDGTSTYAGITGVTTAIKGLSGTIANIAGLVVGTGNAYSELTLADFNKVVAKLPQFADTPNARWFVSKQFWGEVMQKLALAAGGVTAAEIVNGARQPEFLGYPVEISQVLPAVEANSQVCALLGDLSLAAKMGDRRGITVAATNDLYFASDMIGLRATQRFDIVTHDVGNASGTASLRVPGPIVGLITAAS